MTGAADGFDGYVFEGGAEVPAGYTQREPMTFAEMTALLDSYERHKQRLIVPTARVAEFETAVRAAGLGHAVAVVGHPWLKPDQAYLMYSEAEQEADMQRALEAGTVEMLEQIKADAERLRAQLEEEAQQERERAMWTTRPWPQSPFTGLSGI